MGSKTHYIVTVDERIARLYAGSPTPGGSVQLTQVDSIENRHEEEHQRGRPDMLPGPGHRNAQAGVPGAGSGAPHFATPRETGKEESRRFAREVKSWLGKVRQDSDGVSIFAATRFLGLLRKELGDAADIREAELAQMPERELQDHPAIQRAVPWKAGK